MSVVPPPTLTVPVTVLVVGSKIGHLVAVEAADVVLRAGLHHRDGGGVGDAGGEVVDHLVGLGVDDGEGAVLGDIRAVGEGRDGDVDRVAAHVEGRRGRLARRDGGVGGAGRQQRPGGGQGEGGHSGGSQGGDGGPAAGGTGQVGHRGFPLVGAPGWSHYPSSTAERTCSTPVEMRSSRGTATCEFRPGRAPARSVSTDRGPPVPPVRHRTGGLCRTGIGTTVETSAADRPPPPEQAEGTSR